MSVLFPYIFLTFVSPPFLRRVEEACDSEREATKKFKASETKFKTSETKVKRLSTDLAATRDDLSELQEKSDEMATQMGTAERVIGMNSHFLSEL